MKNPSVMTPREVMEAYMFMAAFYAERSSLLADAMAQLVVIESSFVEKGVTSAAARTMASATEGGRLIMQLKGEVKGLEEMIKALKKAQQYYAEEAKNNF